MEYKYWFSKGPVNEQDIPAGSISNCLYIKPVYTRQFERETWGYAVYRHRLSEKTIRKNKLLEDARNRLHSVMKG